MGCEQGGCGHHRLPSEIEAIMNTPEEPIIQNCDLNSSRSIGRLQVTPMTRESFFSSYEGDDEISVYENKDDFLSSLFFHENYYTGEIDLEGKWMWDVCTTEHERILGDSGEVIMLRPKLTSENTKPAENLQRMLLALGYLNPDNLDPSRAFDDSGTRETDIIYLGKLGQAEHSAMKQFQVNNDLEPTGIVTNIEREILYTLMFENFHSSE